MIQDPHSPFSIKNGTHSPFSMKNKRAFFTKIWTLSSGLRDGDTKQSTNISVKGHTILKTKGFLHSSSLSQVQSDKIYQTMTKIGVQFNIRNHFISNWRQK